jgi:Domain of unknown function (DUF4219)
MMSEATTSLGSILIKQLNNSNYLEWAIRMEAILVREGLWSLVKPTAEEKDKCIPDKMAQAWA